MSTPDSDLIWLVTSNLHTKRQVNRQATPPMQTLSVADSKSSIEVLLYRIDLVLHRVLEVKMCARLVRLTRDFVRLAR